MNKPLYQYFSVSAIVVAVDLYTKHLIQQRFHFGDALQINSFFDIVRAHNTGAAFSFLANAGGWQKWFFGIISMLAIVVLTHLILKNLHNKLFCTGAALVLGGAVGNLYDRLTLGYVVDFLSFHINNLYWPAFNVADSAICVGVAFLLLDSVKADKKV